MNISNETRKALLGDLSDSELREELQKREGPCLSYFANGRDNRHVYMRKLERGGDRYHVLAGNGDVVWMDSEAVRDMIASLTKLLEA